MSGHHPWSEIGDRLRADPERAARIAAIRREMAREIAAAEDDRLGPDNGSHEGTGESVGHAASADRPLSRPSAPRRERGKAAKVVAD